MGTVISEQTINGCRHGDRAEQRKLYEALAPAMFATCIRYMGDRDTAEDVLQDGFISLFSKIGSFSGKGSFEGWARRIFVNTALMALRKTDALKLSSSIEDAKDISSELPTQLQNMGYHELLHLVASLPTGFRTVFNMYVIEGFSHEDIAKALGITAGTSRSQLQRARMILQEKINDNGRKKL